MRVGLDSNSSRIELRDKTQPDVYNNLFPQVKSNPQPTLLKKEKAGETHIIHMLEALLNLHRFLCTRK
jgi:hypothetical protein